MGTRTRKRIVERVSIQERTEIENKKLNRCSLVEEKIYVALQKLHGVTLKQAKQIHKDNMMQREFRAIN